MRNFLIIVLILCLGIAGCGPEDKWETAIRSSDPEKRIEAANALKELGSNRALTILTVAKGDKDFRVNEAIEKAIKKIQAQTFMK